MFQRSAKSYKEEKKLGKGSFGTAVLVKNKDDKKQYVMKKIKITDDESKEYAEREVQILSALDHPFIVSYKESFSRKKTVYLIMEYCPSGDLAAFLEKQKPKPLPEDRIVDWTVQLAIALKYLHSRNVLHRDLKPANIFLTMDDVIKIGDFGISRKLPADAVAKSLALTTCGSPLYTSPECLKGQPYDDKTDVWGLGCVVYEMMTYEPAVNPQALMIHHTWRVSRLPSTYSHNLLDIVHRMLTKDSVSRPSIADILDTPFMKDEQQALMSRLNQRLCEQLLSAEANRTLPVQQLRSPASRTVSAPPAPANLNFQCSGTYLPMNKCSLMVFDALNEAESKLRNVGYGFVDDQSSGQVILKNLKTNSKYEFNVFTDPVKNEQHYQQLAAYSTEYVQAHLEVREKLVKRQLPIDADGSEDTSFVFTSQDFETNTRMLMVLIHGSGAPRAGEWSRKVILNDSLDAGSQVPYVQWATQQGYAVLILNPNEPVRGSETDKSHTLYVWDHIVVKSPAKQIAIVAHSSGGAVSLRLAVERKDQFLRRVSALALTDSVHTIYAPDIPADVIRFFKEKARNWTTSDQPLDTPLDKTSHDAPKYSSGEQRHEWTSWSSMDAVFKFIASTT